MRDIYSVIAALLMITLLCGSAAPDEAAPLPGPIPTEEPMPGSVPDAEPEHSSIFDIISTAAPADTPAYQVDMAAWYMEEMLTAAAEGDTKAGRDAEAGRNAAIDAAGSKEQKISFDELYLLARVIFSEAGSDWLDEEFRLCVGEVVLNRMASPEFPDSMQDVVYQKGQYSGVNSAKFASLAPGEDCVDVALKLLQGERRMVPAVVFQSDFVQGEIFSMYSDRRLGTTYFCLSPNLDLYPID